MMVRQWLRRLPFLFLLAFLVFQGSVQAADWKLCSENEFLTLYFDTDSLIRMASDRVKVWTKYVPKGIKGRIFGHISALSTKYRSSNSSTMPIVLSSMNSVARKRPINWFPGSTLTRKKRCSANCSPQNPNPFSRSRFPKPSIRRFAPGKG